MLHFEVQNGKLVSVSTESQRGESWITRHAFKTLEQADEMAAQATELTGDLHVGVDNGSSVWPRYDVVRAPKVGDEVSYAFNGDYYPDGVIAKVSATLIVTTSTGNTYRRRRKTGRWAQPGGTWSLVHGHHSDKNPHF